MLDKYRKEIDQIDKKILALLGQRVALFKKIGRLKRQQKLPIKDKEREAEKVAKLAKQAEKVGIDILFINDIWKRIFQESYKIEEKA
ncbi:chorismate mutase [Candidatus Microgenomates bacterium]|nr:chorismate mutase [Candidatus Microgenomates bacterium]